MKISDCAILLWMLLLLLLPMIDAANINSRELINKEKKHLVNNITRHYEGDIIFIKDDPSSCSENTCLEIFGGSATLYHNDEKSTKNGISSSKCKCQCLSHLKTYREDEGLCVDTIRECSLVPFISSSTALDTAEKIPSVFLPLQGQIIYPSKELFFADEYADSKCVVMTANYMTNSGWVDNKNFFQSNEVPFRLFTDKNRTFLQWSGDVSHRSLLQGRLILLRISCLDISSEFQRNTYSPCVSFRVSGSLLKHKANITEVQFAIGASDKEKESLSTNEYVIIAITSFCLGLMYIASVFLYIYLKKKKDRERNNGANSVNGDKNFTRGDPDLHASRSSYRRNSSLAPSIEFIDNPEANIIKSNPLMKHFMSFNENSAFVSDSSDAESTIHRDSSAGNSSSGLNDSKNFSSHNSSQEQSECLPEEDVSITEDGDKNDGSNNRTFQNGTTRRKLYFNPAYFEPELLAQPPPAAMEFLTKIREVITMAKGKMAAKRFQPVLNYIPEEGSQASNSEIYSPGTLKSRNSTVSSRKNSSKDCTGCPGCENNKKSPAENNLSPNIALKNCKNCGDKQKSIQKWLENVSNATNELSDCSIGSNGNSKKDDKRPLISLPILQEDETANQSDTSSYNKRKIKKEEISIVKGFVKEKNIFVQRDRGADIDPSTPENSGSIPKIISHSLKKNIKEMIYSQNFVRDKVNVFESKKKIVDTQAHEIYNNPKFNMDQEIETPLISRPPYSSVVKKKQEVLDQFSNPSKRPIVVVNGKFENYNNHNKTLNNQMPDMIYEAIEMEKKNKPINYQSPPTPDYSSEYEMTKFKKYDNVSFAPFVPTPDYHTYGKNTLRSLKQYQPDSPIYSRKSPAYLVVDYETDSLERLNTYKRSRTPVSTPTSRSDFSSQPSPSALPMEEEVEIRNALYDREEGFRKDSDTIKKEREIDIQMRKTKIKYNTPNEGSMTIELEGISPDENDDASSTNSDEFEPDTLDRHAKINKTVLEKIKMERSYTPAATTTTKTASASHNKKNLNIVEEKIDKVELIERDDLGRILTLEVRHSKRQRNIGEASLKKLPHANQSKSAPIPPDVISSNIKQPLIQTSNKQQQQQKQHEDEVLLIPAKKHLQQKAFENSIAARKTNQHILDEHDYKKSQISAPILTTGIESSDKKVNKTLRGDFLKMDLLNLDTNYHQNKINRDYQPSLIKTIYHVELPSPPKFDKEDIYSGNESGKKSKDFKNAWKRFMGIASSKVLNGSNNNGNKKYDSDDDVVELAQNKSVTTSEIKQGKVKDIIKKLNIVHHHVDTCKLKEYDSGYLSAESNNNDNSLTDIITTKSDNSSDKSVKNIKSRPAVPPPPIPMKIQNNAKKQQQQQNSHSNNNKVASNLSVSLVSTNHYMNSEDLVNINIYSSDDEEQNSSVESEEDERHFDTCEDVGADSDFSFVN